MAFRKGRAQGRHGGIDALLVELQHIEIPLHHQRAIPHLSLGAMEPEQNLALAEKGRFARIQVLGLVVPEGAAPKGD